MGTKNKPGVFDCYTNAEPDEPMFVLLGRDESAAVLVRLWCIMRRARKGLADADSKEAEAEECAKAMERWLEGRGRPDSINPEIRCPTPGCGENGGVRDHVGPCLPEMENPCPV